MHQRSGLDGSSLMLNCTFLLPVSITWRTKVRPMDGGESYRLHLICCMAFRRRQEATSSMLISRITHVLSVPEHLREFSGLQECVL